MIAQELAVYLDAEGVAALGATLFYGHKPDTPDGVLALYDESAAVLPESNAIAVDNFGVQVLARAATYAAARDLVLAVHRKIVGFHGALVNGGTNVEQVRIQSGPFSIGRDEKSRAEWTAHYVFRVTSTGDAIRS